MLSNYNLNFAHIIFPRVSFLVSLGLLTNSNCKALSTLATTVADFSDCRWKQRLSLKSATVTENAFFALLYFYNVSSYSAIQPQVSNKLSVSVCV